MWARTPLTLGTHNEFYHIYYASTAPTPSNGYNAATFDRPAFNHGTLATCFIDQLSSRW